METKHTPGPWTAHPIELNHGLPYTPVAASTLIAKAYSTAFGDHEQSEANARLIAAAPELLKELDRLLSAVMQNSDADQTEMGLKPFIRPALAAIAKATGS
ncbi:hypothetical protein [Microvirgula aerodenitrificans]|uniref:hypothetical protein n=1 Tax=Microvirgula aerodenitrificans TaxID=57480 RepID=UPI0028ED3E6B|nr:hypothetical protein [Microvirgula aerodenitrificans]